MSPRLAVVPHGYRGRHGFAHVFLVAPALIGVGLVVALGALVDEQLSYPGDEEAACGAA